MRGCTFAGRRGLAFSLKLCSLSKIMFTLIRSVIIIGLIFYFSPARHQTAPGQPSSGGPAPNPAVSSNASEAAQAQDDLWDMIVGSIAQEAVRTAVEEKVQGAGLRLKEQASSLAESVAKPAPVSTSRAPDPSAAGQATGGSSVRCIYRCDGTE
jgi:hypothetical protein